MNNNLSSVAKNLRSPSGSVKLLHLGSASSSPTNYIFTWKIKLMLYNSLASCQEAFPSFLFLLPVSTGNVPYVHTLVEYPLRFVLFVSIRHSLPVSFLRFMKYFSSCFNNSFQTGCMMLFMCTCS